MDQTPAKDQRPTSYSERHDAFVREQIEAGRYESAEAVVDAGLDVLRFQEQDFEQMDEREFARLKEAIDEGFAALERGDYKTYSSGEELCEDIMAEVHRRLAAK